MKKHRTLTLLLPLAIISCAAPAVYNSANGQVEVRQASPALVQQGNQAFAQYKAQHRVSQNHAARARVYRVATKLRPVVNLPGANWEFEVFDDASANAFALPGGKVGINTGLLNIAKTDGQLAAALAHEMAHVTSNHAQSRIQTNQAIQLGGAVLGALIGGENPQTATQYATGAANLVFGRSFSRSQELQADQIGTVFMARAGYDPAEAVRLWQNMAARGGAGVPEFLSTHPISSTRIKALQDFLPQARAQRR